MCWPQNVIRFELLYYTLNVTSFSSEKRARPWYRAESSAEENRRAREAYRVLLTVTLRKPDSEEYLKFAQEVQQRAKDDYNYSYASNEVRFRHSIA